MDTPAWARAAQELTVELGTSPLGLTEDEVARRRKKYGRNTLRPQPMFGVVILFLRQFKSPLVLILIFASIVAMGAQEWVDATLILCIIFLSACMAVWQEYRATAIINAMRARLAAYAIVIRGGVETHILADDLVPGDIVRLSAGSLIPADGVVLDAKDCFVNQAILTGESFPVEKFPGNVSASASLAERTNMVYMGTSVHSGVAHIVVVSTGARTEFGRIGGALQTQKRETNFEHGMRQFGYLLTRVIVALVVFVCAALWLTGKPALESLLFALALAVGISPEMLPAILSVTLAHGARKMAQRGVIVRRLNAIENFGSMDVLCTDKTGTITEGVIQLNAAVDVSGKPDSDVLALAFAIAATQTGIANPLDDALVRAGRTAGLTVDAMDKVDEIPYDFTRKRMSVVIRHRDHSKQIITKGAVDKVLPVCGFCWSNGNAVAMDAARHADIERQFEAWSAQGFRVLAVASKPIAPTARLTANDENALILAGFLLFFDPPDPQAQRVIGELAGLGVRLKIITGDNRHVARYVARGVGMPLKRDLTGEQLNTLRDEALWALVEEVDLFSEVDPYQKERILRALQHRGHIVGFLGDGINDAPAIQAADVGISVDRATDVAKQAADFVLLEHDLEVLRQGVEEGRATFANTLKYIFITTSANFGNMLSMAVAALFLPFLPLLATQILLNNFLSDFPSMLIARDRIDRDWALTPHRWDNAMIRNFMIVFGVISSVFDILTFSVLWWLSSAQEAIFHTGWFVESLLTELLVIFVLRTALPFYGSRPDGKLFWVSIAFVCIAIAIPFLPGTALFGFTPLPTIILCAIVAITVAYLAATEWAKRRFYAILWRG